MDDGNLHIWSMHPLLGLRYVTLAVGTGMGTRRLDSGGRLKNAGAESKKQKVVARRPEDWGYGSKGRQEERKSRVFCPSN